MRGAWQQGLREFWRRRRLANVLLLPLAGAFGLAVALRRQAYALGLCRVRRFKVPVVVVGCLTAGGGGKTTLVGALAAALSGRGLKVGIVLRGYGRKGDAPALVAPATPRAATAEDLERYGDEALLLARTGCAVAVGADRAAAVALLLEGAELDVVLSDDGLQHHALGRDVEILVLTAGYGFGNGWLLPAGPLREGSGRRERVDFVVRKGAARAGEHALELGDGELRRLDGAKVTPDELQDKELAAVAGIAAPDEFFADLESHGLRLGSCHVFADHHRYRAAELRAIKADHLVMTAKDAIKCHQLDEDGRILVFSQKVRLAPDLIDQLGERIARSKAP